MRVPGDFSARNQVDRESICENTWCDVCGEADIGLLRPVEYQEDGRIFVGRPWVLATAEGDPVAYFDVYPDLDGEPNLHIVANISGRHYHEDAAVVALLKPLQRSVGSVVKDDH